MQLNRIAINGAVGDEIVNAGSGKRASPDGRLNYVFRHTVGEFFSLIT